MKDHRPPQDTSARYLAGRAHRHPLPLSPASRMSRADSPDAELPAPIVHGTLSGGLGRDQLLGDFATVQITVGPWDFPQMTDIIVLHWGEQWDDELPVTDTNGAQLLSIPGIDIAGDRLGDGDHYTGEGTQAVWYEIRTASGTVKPSATTRVVVKTARPGGQDPRPDEPVNDNLATPTASPNPVEAGTTEVIFSVKPWKNIAIDDKLVLVVGGSAFPFAALTDIAAVQTLTLSAEQVAAIGGGPKTPVSYQITDRVGNLSGYAPYLPLDIWLETGDRLEMIELTDDAGAFIEDAINPAMSKGKAIVPRYKGWAVGESVTVVLEGVDSNGQAYTTTLGPEVWKPTLFYLEFKILNEDLRPLAGGIVRVYYQTSANKFSVRRLYVVNALPQTGLPPVFVRGEHGDELPLDDIVGDYVNIVVPDSEALIDFARITLTMEGSGASGPVHEEETHNVGEGEGHTPYAFVWLKTRVDPLLERTATFRYSVRTLDAAPQGRSVGPRLHRRPLGLRGLRGIRDSEPHDLLIKQNSSGGQLPAPIVVDLVDGAVSPTLPTLKLTVPGGAASAPGAKVVTTVVGLTTVTRTDVIFDQGETLHVDFPGWPAVNDGAKATASYTIEGTPSKQATFDVGAVVPFQIDDSPVAIDIDQDYPREATGGTLPYTYTSSAPAIVSVPVAGNGLIRGVAAGTATITARDSAQGMGQYAVTVKNEAGPFAIDDNLVMLDVNADFTRHATGGTLPYKYTSNSAIVSVPDINNGVIIAKAAGTAMITARDNAGASGSYPVIVSDSTTPFHISPSQVSITDTESYTRNATGGTPPYTYISSNTAIVSVPNLHYGVIQAQAAGNATIIASDSAGAGGSYPVVVSAVAVPVMEDFTLQPTGKMVVGAPVTLTTMTVTLLENDGWFHEGLYVGYAWQSGFAYGGRVRLDLNTPCRNAVISGRFTNIIYTPSYVQFFDQNGALLASMPYSKSEPFEAAYTASSPSLIARIELYCPQVDNSGSWFSVASAHLNP